MDGYPRTQAQAQAFDSVLAEARLKLDRALLLVVPDQVIVQPPGRTVELSQTGLQGDLPHREQPAPQARDVRRLWHHPGAAR